MKISIIIPTYNEEITLEQVVLKVEKVFNQNDYEIIIVDDGSTDFTSKIISKIKNSHILSIHHDKNYGKGKAIRSGLNITSGDYLAVQDADLEYLPETLLELWQKVKNENTVVYGRRSLNQGYFFNRIGNKVVSFICSILYRVKLYDIYTCYKIIPSKILRSLELKSNGFEIEAEITAKLLRRNVQILEIPISYTPRSFFDGKKIRMIDGLKAILTLLKIRYAHKKIMSNPRQK